MRLFAIAACGLLVVSFSASSKETRPAQTIQFSTQAFDITSTSLPPRFNGNSPFALYDVLNKRPALKKSEFETTDQFRIRQVAAASKPFLGGLSAEDNIAISLTPPGEDSAYKLSYDADTSKMNLRISEALSPRSCSIRLKQNSRRTGSYIGGNAFGATARVTEHEVNYFCLGGVTRSDVSFPLTPARAQEIKKNLRILLIGLLAPPYVSETADHIAATISNPADVIFKANILHLNVEQIWVYDWATGEIVYRPGMHQEITDQSDSTPEPTEALDQNGNNLIHQSIWTDRFASAKSLIAKGAADVNGRNKFGATPLHMAVWKKRPELVRELLAAGADKSVRDNDGKRPLDDALDKGFAEIVQLLR